MSYFSGKNTQLRYPTIFQGLDPLGDRYQVHSTPTNRTIESAFSHMIGIFGDNF